MVSFAEPVWLWLLAGPAVAVVLAAYRHRRRMALQRTLASPAVWDRLMGGAPATGLLRLLGWTAAAAFVVLALARPQWGEVPGVESVRTRDLVVAVDVSDSMLCPDLRPARLVRALELIHRVLPALEGNRVGVVVFAGDAYPLVPLTTDLQAAASFLQAVEPGMVATPGSNLERAVQASLKLMPEEGEGRVVVLITDGENLQGDMDSAAKAMSDGGVGMLGVVAGTAEGGPIPTRDADGSIRYKRDQNDQPVVTRAHRDVLEAVAEKAGGEVIELGSSEVIADLIAAVEAIRTREIEATRKVEKVERFPIFLTAAAVLLLLSFLASPWRRRAAAVAILAVVIGVPAGAQQAPQAPPQGAPQAPQAPPGAAAEQPPEQGAELRVPWWQRLIPGGSRRLARSGKSSWQDGDLQSAVESFAGAAMLDPESPERLFDLGTTLAVGGQLEPAVAMLEQAQRGEVAGAAYNAGTASLGQSQPDLAVQWLRRALLEEPDNPEAKRNYELALKMLQEQEQEQQEQEQQDEQEQNEDQDQEQEQEEQQQEQEGEPTPTPTPAPNGAPQPTPTPDPNNPIYAALERAEAEARESMLTATPQAVKVEKDW